MAEIQFFGVNQLVWVNETGSDIRDSIRKFGYSLKGEPPVYNRFLHRGQVYLQYVLCPLMEYWDTRSPREL